MGKEKQVPPLEPSTNGTDSESGLPGSEASVFNVMKRFAEEKKGLREPDKALVQDQGFADRFPHLWAWWTATQIGEAFEREPCRLSLSIETGFVVASLNDDALECSLSANGSTVWGALGALNDLIVIPDAPWRHWKRRREKLRPRRETEKKA